MRRLLPALVLLCTLAPAAPALAADPKERIVISGQTVIDKDEVTGDVVVVDGDVLVRGRVDGDLFAIAGDVVIRGEVTGDVVTLAGQAVLGRRAQIGGDLIYADDKPRVTRGATVSGETKKFDGDKITGPIGVAAITFWAAVGISMFLLGLILLLLAPRAADAVALTARTKWGASIGVGIGAVILLPIIATIALITILGAPLGFILFLLLVPLAAIGYVSAAFFVGRLIIKGARIPAFLVGLLILRLLALIPFAGGVIGFLATIFGLGALLLAMLRARS